MSIEKKIVVAGGGIAGLSLAYNLILAGIPPKDIAVIEKESQAGGNIKTFKNSDICIDEGPNGFLDNAPHTIELIDNLKIGDNLLKSSPLSSDRFIYRAKKLRKIESNPLKFLTGGVLPLHETVRVALEPFQKQTDKKYESVYEFAKRRIGKGAASILVDAMVSGVFAGDAKKLELASAFPKMYAMEKEHGSLVKAMIAKKKAGQQGGGPAGPGGRLTSFKDGLYVLINALEKKLRDILVTGIEVTDIDRENNLYKVNLSSGEVITAQTVVLATPAWASANIVKKLDPQIAEELMKIYYPPVTVVATAYPSAAFKVIPKGFGFLVPRNQDVSILGTLWTSSVFSNRAKDDTVLLRTMTGGALNSADALLDDSQITALVNDSLKKVMNINIAPEFIKIFRYKKAIAQYNTGHQEKLKKLSLLSNKYQGFYLTGSSYNGISINNCITASKQIAPIIIKFIQKN